MEKTFRCFVCQKNFVSKASLELHVKTVHEKFKPFHCQYCKLSFAQQANLLTHMEKKHRSNNLASRKIQMFDQELHFTNMPVLASQRETDTSTGSTTFSGSTTSNKLANESKKPEHFEDHQHPQQHQAKQGTLDCSECSIVFPTFPKLVRHLVSIHNAEIAMDNDNQEDPPSKVDSVHKVRCDLCKLVFSSKGNLQTHVKSVHEKLKPFKCEKCPKSFAQRINLTSHVKNNHTGSMENHTSYLECKECDKILITKTGLKRHMIKIHNEECSTEKSDWQVCEFCKQTFSSKGNLKTHIRTIHQEVRLFACKHCKVRFSQKGNLENHTKVRHKDMRQEQSSMCESSVIQTNNLDPRLKDSHKRGLFFNCNLCKLQLHTWKALVCHVKRCKQNTGLGRKKPQVKEMKGKKEAKVKKEAKEKRETKEKKENKKTKETKETKKKKQIAKAQHECEQCGEIFKKKSNLCLHQNVVHTRGEQIHLCHICPMNFRCKKSLNYHLKVDHEEVFFQCQDCGKKYQEKNVLDGHIQRCHLKTFTRLDTRW